MILCKFQWPCKIDRSWGRHLEKYECAEYQPVSWIDDGEGRMDALREHINMKISACIPTYFYEWSVVTDMRWNLAAPLFQSSPADNKAGEWGGRECLPVILYSKYLRRILASICTRTFFVGFWPLSVREFFLSDSGQEQGKRATTEGATWWLWLTCAET